MLESLNPRAILQRGYAIMIDGDGKVLRDSAAVAIGDEVQATLASGELGLTVNRVD